METFTPNMEVGANMLLLDKIELRLEGWYILASTHGIQTMLGSLRDCISEGRIPDFNTYRGSNDQTKYTVKIADASRLVFGGKIVANLSRRNVPREDLGLLSSDDLNLYSLQIDLMLNPTRFANFQTLTEITPDSFRLRFDAPQLRCIPPRRGRVRESPLYDCNNYLRTEWHRAALSQSTDMVAHCIGSAVAFLRNELNEASGGTGAALHTDDLRYNLKAAEVYLDVIPEAPMHPINFVCGLYDAVRSYGLSLREHLYEVRPLNQLVSSRSFACKIAPAKEIAIYAKTSRRVRFEVRFDLTKDAGMLHDSNSRSHVTNDPAVLLHWLTERLPVDAAEELQRFFGHIANTREAHPNQCPVHDFIGEIATYCGMHTKTVLACLMRDRSIRSERRNGVLKHYLRVLKDVGILEHVGSGHRQVYCLTPQYQQAIDILAGLPRISED